MFPRGLLKEHAQVFSLILRMADAGIVMFSAWLGGWFWLGRGWLPQHHGWAMLLAGGITVPVFSFFGLYESVRVLQVWQYILRMCQAWATVLALLGGLAFLTKTGETFSRGWFLLSSLFSLAGLVFSRTLVLLLLRLMRQHGWNERRVVIVGAGGSGQRLADMLVQKLWTGFRVGYLFDDGPGPAGLGTSPLPDGLEAWLAGQTSSIDEIWIALPPDQQERICQIVHQLRHYPVPVRLALDVFRLLGLSRYSISDVGGFPMLTLNATPIAGMNRFLKAAEDRVIALVALVLVSPLFLLIAGIVRLSSPGPIFFRQKRHGWDGRIIEIYKFRTMHCHKEDNPDKLTQASRFDRRVTWAGRWLRRTSLDELPQLVNVLQGRMSIVGPRPHALAHNALYRDVIRNYMQRHRVKPGITGWAQVHGWRGETDTLDKMQKRVELDLYYIENWSLLLDVKIMLMTVFRGFGGKNAW